MLHIDKKHSPIEFRKAKQEFGHYDELPGERKDQLKRILIEEQSGLCAYCMVRIGMHNSSIEHYVPRNGENGDPTLSLDYKNLLAVCQNGRDGGEFKHCDVTRGNKMLTVDPRKKEDIQSIGYRSDGTIYAAEEQRNDDLNSEKMLNLNHPALKSARKTTVEQVKLQMASRHRGQWNKAVIQRYLEHYSDVSSKISYAGIVIYELEKRLRRG